MRVVAVADHQAAQGNVVSDRHCSVRRDIAGQPREVSRRRSRHARPVCGGGPDAAGIDIPTAWRRLCAARRRACFHAVGRTGSIDRCDHVVIGCPIGQSDIVVLERGDVAGDLQVIRSAGKRPLDRVTARARHRRPGQPDASVESRCRKRWGRGRRRINPEPDRARNRGVEHVLVANGQGAKADECIVQLACIGKQGVGRAAENSTPVEDVELPRKGQIARNNNLRTGRTDGEGHCRTGLHDEIAAHLHSASARSRRERSARGDGHGTARGSRSRKNAAARNRHGSAANRTVQIQGSPGNQGCAGVGIAGAQRQRAWPFQPERSRARKKIGNRHVQSRPEIARARQQHIDRAHLGDGARIGHASVHVDRGFQRKLSAQFKRG